MLSRGQHPGILATGSRIINGRCLVAQGQCKGRTLLGSVGRLEIVVPMGRDQFYSE